MGETDRAITSTAPGGSFSVEIVLLENMISYYTESARGCKIVFDERGAASKPRVIRVSVEPPGGAEARKMNINPVCASCARDCKQPSGVNVVSCPKYERASRNLDLFDSAGNVKPVLKKRDRKKTGPAGDA